MLDVADAAAPPGSLAGEALGGCDGVYANTGVAGPGNAMDVRLESGRGRSPSI
jgi:hypothetical protein